VFFAHPEAHFHSIVVDTSQLRHRVFNAGDRDTGFNKEIYQLVLKCGRLYPKSIFHVFPDRRSTIHPTEELRTIINHGMHKKFGRSRDCQCGNFTLPIGSSVRFFSSRISSLAQLPTAAMAMTGILGQALPGSSSRPRSFV
jgi:hypothetical protein